jgi:hypothetical protein
MRSASLLALSLLALALLPMPQATADPKDQAAVAPELILEQFDIFTDGDALLVPVSLGARKYLFLVDTGASEMVYDTSLPELGEPIEVIKAKTANGDQEYKLYREPRAEMGKLQLQSHRPILGMDLTAIRQASGHAIYGIIGMSFLRHQALRLDFEKGKLYFLKADAPREGTSFRFHAGGGGAPHLFLDIAGLGLESFLVDTGFVGSSALIQPDLVDRLQRTKNLRLVNGLGLAETFGGKITNRMGLLNSLALGDFTRKGVIADEGKLNLLGLEYWRRFHVTFDFPAGQVYLAKNRHFDRQDRFDLSGLHFRKIDGNVVIELVDPGSPADICSVKAKDMIQSANGKLVDSMRLHTLRLLLRQENEQVRLTLRRGTREFAVTIPLKDWRTATQ